MKLCQDTLASSTTFGGRERGLRPIESCTGVFDAPLHPEVESLSLICIMYILFTLICCGSCSSTGHPPSVFRNNFKDDIILPRTEEPQRMRDLPQGFYEIWMLLAFSESLIIKKMNGHEKCHTGSPWKVLRLRIWGTDEWLVEEYPVISIQNSGVSEETAISISADCESATC